MHNYRSKFEASIGAYLELTGIPYKYEAFVFRYYVPVRGICLHCARTNINQEKTYTPDFSSKDDAIIIETKGKFTQQDRTKMIHVKEQYPDHTFYLLFQRDNWMTKTKKRRYSDWCKLKGFEYHVGTSVPKKWLKELAEHSGEL